MLFQFYNLDKNIDCIFMMEEPPSDFYVKRWEFIINKVKNNNNLQTLIFIDGDQSQEEIRRLTWINPEGGNILIIVIAGSKTIIPQFYIGTERWCYWYNLSCHIRGVADMATAMMTRELDIILDKEIQFIIASRDLSFKSITKLLETFGREVYYIDHSSTNLCLFVLYNSLRFPTNNFSELARIVRIMIKQRVNNIKSNIPNDTLNKQWEKLVPELSILSNFHIRYETIFELDELIKIYLHKFRVKENIRTKIEKEKINFDTNHPILIGIKKLLDEKGFIHTGVMGQKFELTQKLREELGGHKWKLILQREEVATFLNAKIIYDEIHTCDLLVSNNYKPKESEAKIEINIEDMTPDQLRNKFTRDCKMTYKEFLGLYVCNRTNFSSFIHKRKNEDPQACLAIKKWLHFIHPDGKTEIDIE